MQNEASGGVALGLEYVAWFKSGEPHQIFALEAGRVVGSTPDVGAEVATQMWHMAQARADELPREHELRPVSEADAALLAMQIEVEHHREMGPIWEQYERGTLPEPPEVEGSRKASRKKGSRSKKRQQVLGAEFVVWGYGTDPYPVDVRDVVEADTEEEAVEKYHRFWGPLIIEKVFRRERGAAMGATYRVRGFNPQTRDSVQTFYEVVSPYQAEELFAREFPGWELTEGEGRWRVDMKLPTGQATEQGIPYWEPHSVDVGAATEYWARRQANSLYPQGVITGAWMV